MARKQPRANLAIDDADALAVATSEAHLRQREPALATAALLPLLDRAGATGHAPSRLAAALLRSMQAPSPREPYGMGGATHLAQAVQRLTALTREQDGQIAQMQALLEALL